MEDVLCAGRPFAATTNADFHVLDMDKPPTQTITATLTLDDIKYMKTANTKD